MSNSRQPRVRHRSQGQLPVWVRLVLTLLCGAALLAACDARRDEQAFTYRPPADPAERPEAESGWTEKPGRATKTFAVAAANPLATDAGYQVLRAGGSAIDAAIAVQMVLTLVEPQSSGIGGGTFVLHWNGDAVEAFDGRETAPAAVDERLFLKDDGQPMDFLEGVVGGRSVGTPGTLRVLELAHRRYGRLPWRALFHPAIHLAEQGFRVSPRLHALLMAEEHLKADPVARAYFYTEEGMPLSIGTQLRNPALASTLRLIAEKGPDAFYTGAIAQEIVAKVQSHATNPGRLTARDLAAYEAVTREPLCSDWKRYRICGFPPPSSGGIAVAQILGIVERVRVPQPVKDGLPTPEMLHVYGEAARLAFADRAQYVADPAFVVPPAGSWHSLMDPAYVTERAALIGQQAMATVQPGVPRGGRALYAPMPAQPEFGTSHISIVDAYGNAIAMTTTIENQFGSRQLVRGFLLNNELTDFSFVPSDSHGRAVANRVEPGKRPRSSMSPTLVFDTGSGRLVMSAGSAGGELIIHYTAKTLLATLDWGMNAQQAIALPNFGVTDGPILLEAERFAPSVVASLRARGHQVRELAMTSGLQAIQRTASGWFSGADPRREGLVAGD